MTSAARRQFDSQTVLQEYAESHDLEYVWEGMNAFAKRWRLAQLAQPGTYELVEVRTRRGTTRALLFPKAISREQSSMLKGLICEAIRIKRERLRAKKSSQAASINDICTGGPVFIREQS